MRVAISCILFIAILFGAADAQDEAKGLKTVRAGVVGDRNGTTPDDLRVHLWDKNVGETDITVLTRNLQITLFNHTDKPKEFSIDLSLQRNIDGSPVIPSLSDLSPVTPKPGEVAEIQLAYRGRKDLERVVVVCDMRNDLAERFDAWDGVVRSEVVKVHRAKGTG